jgi:hypothetical protein
VRIVVLRSRAICTCRRVCGRRLRLVNLIYSNGIPAVFVLALYREKTVFIKMIMLGDETVRALRPSCRGLRCPAVTPAHGFGWRGHNAVWPKASVGIKGRMPPQPFVLLGGTLLQRRRRFRSVPSIRGRRVRQRASAQPHR